MTDLTEAHRSPRGPGDRTAKHTRRGRYPYERSTPIMAAFTHTKVLYEIPEAMELLSLSRSVIFEQIRLGRLHSVKEGRARRIPASAIDEYVALLEREAEAA